MKINKHILSLMALTFFIFIAVGSVDDDGSGSSSSDKTEKSDKKKSKKSSSKHRCNECGKGFSGRPYQCIMNMCVEAKTIASGLDKYCSCSCGLEAKYRQGFYNYTCR